MAPPRRGAVKPEQARGLGGHAVRGDQLLLLAERTEEPQGVRPEPDHAHRGDRHQTGRARRRDAPALRGGAPAQHQERQQQPGRELDSHAAGQRERRPAWSLGCRACTRPGRAQQQCKAERQQQQGVVVRAADRHHQEHRVQPEERQRECPRATEPPCRLGRQPDRSEAADGGQRLQCPEPAGQPQGRSRIAHQREQRAVRRVLERPADEAEHRVARGFGREVGVGVEAVQCAHAPEGEVAEDVLGEQRRPEQQDQVGGDHGCRERCDRKRPCRQKGEKVARADHEHERLEPPLSELRADPAQGAGQPARPAAAVGGHVLRRGGGGVHAQHRQGAEKRHQRQPSGEEQRGLRGGPVGAPRRPRRARDVLGLPGYGRRRSSRGLHIAILTASRPSGIHRAR